MGSSRSISSHCDPKTLEALDLAFHGAWNALETRELLARFANVVSSSRDQLAVGGSCLGWHDRS